MSDVRFLADHDLNEHIVTGLLRREPAIDFLRVRDAGISDRPDSEILEYSDREQRVLVSHDVNTMPAAAFGRLSDGDSFPGLLMVPQTAAISGIIESLLIIWSGSELDEWKDQVVYFPLG